jgi:hypothetical protein
MPIEINHLKKSFIISKYHILNAITSILCKFFKAQISKLQKHKNCNIGVKVVKWEMGDERDGNVPFCQVVHHIE